MSEKRNGKDEARSETKGSATKSAGVISAVREQFSELMAAQRHAKKAAPVKPEKTIKGVRADVEAIKERADNHDKRPEHSGRSAHRGAEGTLSTG
ncbi:hypothetical protein [Streptomyces sp. B8F3]|uniref:hypothetical protein n=1 Tax=unclassified Streptomyces TaxID=2593676 RepID=UPI00325F8772